MIGVGNGDTNSHEPEVFLSSVPRSIKVGDWRWKLADVPENGGALQEYAKDFDDSSWEALKLGDANTIKKEHATAIFRARVTLTMGAGTALMEELAVNQRHGFFVNHDLAGYEVPVHADIPHQEVIFLDETDPISSPMKAKGVGELGICGAAAAVANAIYNATGVRVRDYPITLDKLIEGLPEKA